eukprot:jgi/Mesvir1/18049/Mv09366-RA.1
MARRAVFSWRYMLAVVACLQIGGCFLFFFYISPKAPIDMEEELGGKDAHISRLQKELDLCTRHGVAGIGRVFPGKEGLPPIHIVYPTTGEPLKDLQSEGYLHDATFASESLRPAFSIVIAAYNQGPYLRATVDSILAQSFTRWEVIVVDDGSNDETWLIALSLLEEHADKSFRAISKVNGGLADARNVGMRYARGNWLILLDSDDLLGPEYLARIAQFVEEDPLLDIAPGCMRNFDAVSSDWCFPEGFSVTGLSYWNKFHASVPMSRSLMARTGGYDPGLPWGLEDWNFWLAMSAHRPRVRFVPEITFHYRHHAGTSMRKKMFALYLEESKAMVRTNHEGLYEPAQLMLDHETIANMAPASLEKLEAKLDKFPNLHMPRFWRGLVHLRAGRLQNAATDLEKGSNILAERGETSWQISYTLAIAYEKLGNYALALEAINAAFKVQYHDAVYSTKHRLEAAIMADRAMALITPGGREDTLAMPLPVLAEPSYWEHPADLRAAMQTTMAARLRQAVEQERSMGVMLAERRAMVALLQTVTKTECPKVGSGSTHVDYNRIVNPSFELGKANWWDFEGGFDVVKDVGRGATFSEASLFLMNKDLSQKHGALQRVVLNQDRPMPLLVSGWSKAKDVSGVSDAGYALYVDVSFMDGSHEWGWNLAFDAGTHDWQRRMSLLDYSKAIESLSLYCMFRDHTGSVWFDDIVVIPTAASVCKCKEGQLYDPSPGLECQPCPQGKACLLGYEFTP